MKTKIQIICVLMTILICSCGNKNKHQAKRHIPTEKELTVFENEITTLATQSEYPGVFVCHCE